MREIEDNGKNVGRKVWDWGWDEGERWLWTEGWNRERHLFHFLVRF